MPALEKVAMVVYQFTEKSLCHLAVQMAVMVVAVATLFWL
jgi:hypothetical protein